MTFVRRQCIWGVAKVSPWLITIVMEWQARRKISRRHTKLPACHEFLLPAGLGTMFQNCDCQYMAN
jgi:hypothetical protein